MGSTASSTSRGSQENIPLSFWNEVIESNLAKLQASASIEPKRDPIVSPDVFAVSLRTERSGVRQSREKSFAKPITTRFYSAKSVRFIPKIITKNNKNRYKNTQKTVKNRIPFTPPEFTRREVHGGHIFFDKIIKYVTKHLTRTGGGWYNNNAIMATMPV